MLRRADRAASSAAAAAIWPATRPRPEPATGFTLYTDAILGTLPQTPATRRLLLPLGADRADGAMLRAKGWITVAALEPAADWRAEARRLGCSHVLEGGEMLALG